MQPTWSWQVVIMADAIAWCSWGLITGWWYRRKPAGAFCKDGSLLRLRPFETAGRWYERNLRIKSWKDRLPETGGRGGRMSKRRLPRRDRLGLEQFCAECRRGEKTHWALMAASPAFALWNPPSLFLVNCGCGLIAGVPFIAVLRYNRARITAALNRSPADLTELADLDARR